MAMIKIHKGDAPGFLLDPEKKWFKETQRAIEYYENSDKKKSFLFKAYNDKKVKTELFKYFHKCAYCEGRFAATSDGDIEHFRPKGRIIGKIPPTPGYYWLANDWDNLLLSCQHCNQGRIHDYQNLEKTEKSIKRGKEDQFPLRQGGRWRERLDPFSEEEPHRLLLNPCSDDPDIHFEYDMETGSILGTTDMGEKSIEVYALSRKKLVEDRKLELDFFLSLLEILKLSLENYNKDKTEAFKIIVENILIQLKKSTDEKCAYAGMKRFFLRKFLRTNSIIV